MTGTLILLTEDLSAIDARCPDCGWTGKAADGCEWFIHPTVRCPKCGAAVERAEVERIQDQQ
jgi:predicted RNA-binding Zn-ribbon protein involved in translation (DUF1610 family)